MKKMIPLLLVGLILAGCSGGLPNLANLLASPTSPPPTETPTPRPTVTLIPTIDLFIIPTATPVTFTPTATSVIAELATPTPLPLPTFSKQFINDVSDINFFNKTVGFKGILYSSSIMYWNEGPCNPRDIKFTVYVEDPARTDRVFLFLRLRDKKDTLNVSEWSAGAEMIKIDNGSFNYKVEPKNIRRYYYYRDAWIEYQLVAVTKNLEVVGRTQVYDHNIALSMCHPLGSP